MAASQQLRNDMRVAFSPAGATEFLSLINTGILLGSVSVQLRTDIWARFSPSAAKELIQRLYGVWASPAAPTQRLRTELLSVLCNPISAAEVVALLGTVALGSGSAASSSSSGSE